MCAEWQINYLYVGVRPRGRPSRVYMPPWKKEFFMARLNSNKVKINGVDDSVFIGSNYTPSIDTELNFNPEEYNLGNYNSTSIVDRVKNSIPYQNAYEIFSQESDKQWLNELVAIPYSVDDSDPTFWDKIGWSNSYDDKQDAAYQFCMEQISALMSEYHEWKNSLPVTQANQLAQIGSNSAITGQNISPSEFTQQSANTDPSRLSSTNPLEMMRNVSSVFSDIANGALGWFSKLSDLRISERGLDISERGLDISSSSLGISERAQSLSEEEFSFAKTQFKEQMDLAKSDSARNFYQLLLDYLESGYKNVPSVPSAIASEVNDLAVSNLVGDNASKSAQNLASSAYKTTSFHNAAIPNVSDDLLNEMKIYNDTAFEIMKLQYKRDKAVMQLQIAQSNYERGTYTSNYSSPLEYGKYVAQLNDRILRYNSRLSDHQYNYIEALYNRQKEGKQMAIYLYNSMMSGYNPYNIVSDQRNYGLNKAALETGNVWNALNAGNSMLGTFGNFSAHRKK